MTAEPVNPFDAADFNNFNQAHYIISWYAGLDAAARQEVVNTIRDTKQVLMFIDAAQYTRSFDEDAVNDLATRLVKRLRP